MNDPLDPVENARGDERTLLLAFLDDSRAESLRAVEGLTDERAQRRLVPSLTTPMAVLKHLVFVERNWFEHNLGGRTRADLGIAEDAADSWVLSEDDTLADLAEQLGRACDTARAIVAEHDLDDVVVHRHLDEISLRFVIHHVIREHARHAGHADILREQVLADLQG